MKRLVKNATGEPKLKRRSGAPAGTGRTSTFAAHAIGEGYTRLSPEERAARRKYLTGWQQRESHLCEITGHASETTQRRFVEPPHGVGNMDTDTDSADQQGRIAAALLENL